MKYARECVVIVTLCFLAFLAFPTTPYAALPGELEMDAEQYEYYEYISAGRQIGNVQGKIFGERMVHPAFSFGDPLTQKHKQITLVAEIRKILDSGTAFEAIHAGAHLADAKSEHPFARLGKNTALYGGVSLKPNKVDILHLSAGYEQVAYDESFSGLLAIARYERRTPFGSLHISGRHGEAFDGVTLGFSRSLSACDDLGVRFEHISGNHGLGESNFVMATFKHSFGVEGKCDVGTPDPLFSLDGYIEQTTTGKAILVK